jgi:polysaccharide export outer membrane protein
MLDRHRGRLLAELGILASLCALGAGCQTSPLTAALDKDPRVARAANPLPDSRPPAEKQPVIPQARAELARTVRLAPGTILIWSAEATQGPPTPPFHGQSTVEAGGMVSLGPYGRLSVGGLTTEQANKVIAQHLSRYMKVPHVHLTAVFPRPTDGGGTPPQQPPVARSAPRPPVPPAPSPITRVGWTPAPQPAASQAKPESANLVASWLPAPASDGPTLPPAPHAFVPAPGTVVHTIAPGGTQVVSSDSSTPSLLPPEPTWNKLPTTATDTPPATKDSTPSKDSTSNSKDSSSADKDKTEQAPAPRPVSTSAATGDPHFPPKIPCSPTPCPPGGCGQTPEEMHKISLPPYVIEPPDILLVESTAGLRDQPIAGQHAVRPDGTISLGIYGSVYVNGMTLDQARLAVTAKLSERINVKAQDVVVDVLAYNSKVFYVITDGAGFGEQVYRIPITGSETVLDAIGEISGLPPVASKCQIWVARRNPGHGGGQILPVDWIAVSQKGDTHTNYQLYPGDRLYVQSDFFRRLNTAVDKVLSPIERIMGAMLLGSTLANSLKGTTGSVR